MAGRAGVDSHEANDVAFGCVFLVFPVLVGVGSWVVILWTLREIWRWING